MKEIVTTPRRAEDSATLGAAGWATVNAAIIEGNELRPSRAGYRGIAVDGFALDEVNHLR